jgi:hypothetical protein
MITSFLDSSVFSIVKKLTTHRYLFFGIEAEVSVLYLGTFIALTVFLSEIKFYNQRLYMVEIASVVLAILSYVAYVISATIHGMEISKLEKHTGYVEDISEKIIEAI